MNGAELAAGKAAAEQIAAAFEAYFHDPCSQDDCCHECDLIAELTDIARSWPDLPKRELP